MAPCGVLAPPVWGRIQYAPAGQTKPDFVRLLPMTILRFSIFVLGMGLFSLLSACQLPGQPTISDAPPTGKVAFAANREGRYQVYEQDLVSGQVLGDCPSDSCTQPAWHPDGRSMVLVSRREQNYELLRFTPYTGAFETLYTTAEPLGSPQWDTTGQRVTFHQGAINVERIYTLSLGESPKPLGMGRFPRWSPNGQQVLFLQADRRICQQTLTATTPTCLTPVGTADFYPRWSPDGQQIAYLTQQNNIWRLALMQADGSQRRVFLTDQVAQTPAWSPDGKQLAFVVPGELDTSGENAPTRDPEQAIWVVAVDDAKTAKRITLGAGDTLPLWTRDGKWLVFQSSRGGETQLYRVPAIGGDPVRVTPERATHLLSDVF